MLIITNKCFLVNVLGETKSLFFLFIIFIIWIQLPLFLDRSFDNFRL